MINKLWALELFSDINVFVTKVNNNNISLELEIVELPTLTNVKINGLKNLKLMLLLRIQILLKVKTFRKFFN